MKISEFVRRIESQGVKFYGHGSNHDWYYNPKNGKKAQVPRHKTQELRIGTMKGILKALDLELNHK